MRTLDIEAKFKGKWRPVLGHACKTDRQVMAYVARFGMPRPPTPQPPPCLGRITPEFAAELFQDAIGRWRAEWAKGPTLRAVRLRHSENR